MGCSKGGQSNPLVTYRCGSLLPSASADARSSDDVIAFEGLHACRHHRGRCSAARTAPYLWTPQQGTATTATPHSRLLLCSRRLQSVQHQHHRRSGPTIIQPVTVKFNAGSAASHSRSPQETRSALFATQISLPVPVLAGQKPMRHPVAAALVALGAAVVSKIASILAVAAVLLVAMAASHARTVRKSASGMHDGAVGAVINSPYRCSVSSSALTVQRKT